MTASTHLSRKPHSRGSTIATLQLRDAKTEQLRKEIADMNSRPKSESAVRAMMRGIARVMGRLS